MIMCEYDNCATEVARKRHGGRPPTLCDEHRKPVYRKRAQRVRDAQPRAARLSCCEDAGRRGGRIACEQHHTPHDLNGMPEVMHPDDYAGAIPRGKQRGRWPEQAGHFRVTRSPAMVGGQWITERYTRNGAPIRVIGQPDLDVRWLPVAGEPMPAGLVRRGPDWPWGMSS